jgi:hypothetical protein
MLDRESTVDSGRADVAADLLRQCRSNVRGLRNDDRSP